MKRARRAPAAPPFAQMLREAGWLCKQAPMPMLAAMGIDTEYVYVRGNDRLVHLHVSADTAAVEWEARRYVREPFGDYTVVYQALGSGRGTASLQQFAAAGGAR